MPYKPKKPCAFHGCRELTANRYCDAHAKQETKRYNKYDRDSGSNKRYGRTWKRIRDRYIAAHPLCEKCGESGKLTPADEIHHIKPLSKSGTHAADNLMSLCKPCHSEITARNGDRWNRK
ncbi:MAG: HNH endonuclease [Oscillospiraceae bacterium]|nr:HNH endonuclease [Oscillospiraceae bacterium]